MEKKELTFEIGGWARHIHLNKTTDLFIVNMTDKSVLVRYSKEGIFYTQEFFKHELEPHAKVPSKPYRGTIIR